MSRIPATFTPTSTDRSFSSVDAINDIELNTFLELMIAELQNQDPLNPLDNKDMLAQISQIREVGATDKLTKTLDSVLLGQNIASATNLIGADITALSDDGQSVAGIVKHISIDKGVPKLHIEHGTEAVRSEFDGNIQAGTYAYRVVWENDDGTLMGIDLSGKNAVTTTGKDQAIEIRNLPANGKPKQIYRTDASGKEPYQLVGTLAGGNDASFVDRLGDDERSSNRLTQPFQPLVNVMRSYQVTLKNVSGIRPPSLPPVSDDPADNEQPKRSAFDPGARPVFSA